MKQSLLILIFMMSGYVYGQVSGTLSLEQCHELALSSYPAAKQSDLISSASELRQKRLNSNYLPQVELKGQATYQSDVTKVDVQIPPIEIPSLGVEITPEPLETPVPPKDQYKFTMDVYQVIYDGGITGRQKEIDMASYEIEKQKVEIELQKLKETINGVYFNIIILQENEKLLEVLLKDLNNKMRDVTAAVNHGVALSTDRDVLKAEIIRVEQQMEETRIQREAFINILAELISAEIAPSVVLSLPDLAINSAGNSPLRPELQMYEMQKSLLERNKELITSTWRPNLSGFGQAGYGNPGLNFLEDKWTPYYIVGARLNWKIWNWNQNKKDKQILGLQQDIVDRQRETFNKNLNVALEQNLADIRKYESLMMKDREVIDLRTSIAGTASVQLDNGVITSSDYVSRLNEEAQAKLNLEIHKVKLAKAKVDYLTTLGIL